MGRRDEVLKERIEVSLDGRQVFYLFFGGAVVCALCFVLGVFIGRRVEARSQPIAAHQALNDPLAALDQLATDEDSESLLFPKALVGDTGDDVMATADDKIADAPTAPIDPLEMVPEPPQQEKPQAPAAAADGEVADKPEPQAKAPLRFTLQLSSFRDRTEAEAFVTSLRQAGYEPYMTKADVPGRGTFFRVRIGRYRSYDAALEAKASFEKRQKIIAYVTKMR